MENNGYHNFLDPVSLALAATAYVASVTSAVIGVTQQKKMRAQQQALKMLQLTQDEQMQSENIDQVADAQKKQLILNSAITYKKGLDIIAARNRSQKLSVIFFSVAAISLAIMLHVIILKSD